MRAIGLWVVLVGSMFGAREVSKPTPPAKSEPTPKAEPVPTLPGRTWESRTMRTTTTATVTAAWRKTPTRETVTDPQPSLAVAEENETIVLTGKYSPDLLVCSTVLHLCSNAPLEARLALRNRKVFEITEVMKGDLPAKIIEVSPWTSRENVVLPKELKVGTVYTLKFTPSEESRQYLREHQKKDDWYTLRADDRLEVIEIELQ